MHNFYSETYTYVLHLHGVNVEAFLSLAMHPCDIQYFDNCVFVKGWHSF